jgi:hypothetical protein
MLTFASLLYRIRHLMERINPRLVEIRVPFVGMPALLPCNRQKCL